MAKLIPPDLKRCQTEISVTPGARAKVVEGLESHGPLGAFLMGPQAAQRTYRCEYAPTVIATEIRPGADGRRGKMLLCDMHKAKLIEQFGEKFATFKRIKRASEPQAEGK